MLYRSYVLELDTHKGTVMYASVHISRYLDPFKGFELPKGLKRKYKGSSVTSIRWYNHDCLDSANAACEDHIADIYSLYSSDAIVLKELA